MYILYCACKSEKLGKAMNIAAVLTAGDVYGLRPGKNAVFYDREGNDWSAVVTSIVENPLSLKQAFWAPYRKAGKWISDKVNKVASDKEAKGAGTLSNITEGATSAPAAGPDAAAKAAPFDVARFAGIAAMVTMAIAAVAGVLTLIINALKGLTWWQWIILIVALMLIISLPSVFIAWRKLRRRDLGPVLNANGWAVNAASYVRGKFAKGLTSVVKYPKLSSVDPRARRRAAWRRFWLILFALLLAAAAFLFFTDRLAPYGLPYHKEEPVEEVVEEVVEEEAAEPDVEAEDAEAAPEE